MTVDDGVVLDGYMLRPKAFDASAQVSGRRLRLRRACRRDGQRRVGRRQHALPPRHRQPGYVVACFDNRGTPALKGAAWRKVVYGAVGELSSKEQAAAIRALAAQRTYLDRDARRDLGLERWRLEHAQRDVPLSGRLSGGRVRRARSGPAPLRHDLSGTIHGTPGRKREGLSRRLTDSLCRGPAREVADHSRHAATTTFTTRGRSAW